MSPKFRIPRLPIQQLIRHRLLDRIEQSFARGARIVIVHGPAGFGKSTLLAQLAEKQQASGGTIVWITIDQQDRTPQILLDNLAAACRHAGLIVPDRSLSVADLCACFSRDIRVTLVLDEIEHVVDTDAALLLKELSMELPPIVKLVVASREVPLTHMAQLYINGVADLIESTELRFLEAEAQALLRDRLTAAEAREVQELAEGWAIILQLARMHASRMTSPKDIVSELRVTKAQTFQYFLEQIFDRLGAEQAQLLQECSILSYVDVASANAVGQRDNAHALLRGLIDLQPIITITSEEPVALRFHPLFREFLQEVQKQKGTEYVATLHRRAARHFAREGSLAESVRHAMAADDFSLAADILEERGGIAAVFDVGPPVLRNILEPFSNDWLVSRPILGVARVILHAVAGEGAHASFLFNHIFNERLDRFDFDEDEQDHLIINKYLGSLFVNMMSDLQSPLADEYFESLDKMAVIFEKRYPGDARYRGLFLSISIVINQRYENVAAGMRYLAEYRKLCEEEGFAPRLPSIEPQLGLLAFGAGDFESALPYLTGESREATLQFGKREKLLQLASSGVLAKIRYEQDRIEEAKQAALSTVDVLPLTFVEIVTGMISTRALCWLTQGQGQRAIRFLDDSIRQARVSGFGHLASFLVAVKIEGLLRLNRLAEASKVSQANSFDSIWGRDFADKHWVWILAEQVARASVLVLVRNDRAAEARSIAEAFSLRAAEQGRHYMESIGLILEATVCSVLGDEEEASRRLVRALDMTTPMGVIRPFLDLDAVLLPEFHRCTTEVRSAAVAAHIESIYAGISRSLRQGDPVGGLTRRETDILCELAHGDGRKWIAKRLDISPETVKHHMKKLYAKLDASNAREALISAWHIAHSGAD
jgi:ATP/maltotriose-dependent transcriptional regulator MalT